MFKIVIRVKISVLLFSFFILPAAFCGDNKTEVTVLSLKDAVGMAFKNNKDIQIQEKEIGAAKADVLGAEGKFLPTVNLSAGFTRNDAVLYTVATPDMKKDPHIFSGYKNENKAGAYASLPLYRGGGNLAGLQQARIRLNAQKEALREKKLGVEFEVKRLYYGLLLAYETERITNDLFNLAMLHYENVKSRFNQGASSKFDLLQSKVQVSKLTPELIKAKKAVDLITADLKKLIGLDKEKELQLSDSFTYVFMEIKEDEFLNYAYLNNPALAVSSLEVDAGKQSIAVARSSNRPQVDANFGYNYKSGNTGDMFNDTHKNWNAGFMVTIPVFDGFSSKAKVDKASARHKQAILAKEDLNSQIAVDVRSACFDLIQAKAVIDSQEDSVGEAEEALKISEASYTNGNGTNLDVLDAQVSLSQIEKNLSEAIYDYLMAKASLDKIMGVSLLEDELACVYCPSVKEECDGKKE